MRETVWKPGASCCSGGSPAKKPGAADVEKHTKGLQHSLCRPGFGEGLGYGGRSSPRCRLWGYPWDSPVWTVGLLVVLCTTVQHVLRRGSQVRKPKLGPSSPDTKAGHTAQLSCRGRKSQLSGRWGRRLRAILSDLTVTGKAYIAPEQSPMLFCMRLHGFYAEGLK